MTSAFHLCSNAWPPLQEVVITALENTGEPDAAQMALDIVKKWMKNNWLSWKQSDHAIFEKYDVKRVRISKENRLQGQVNYLA